jgi:hypothetical protein
VLRRLAVLTAVVACVPAAPIIGQNVGSGRIVGRVRSGNDSLPGTRVTVAKPDLTLSVIADEEGRFELSDLPQGAYAVTAELAGFQTQSQQNVIVAPGRTSTVNLVLAIGCLAEVVYVDLGIPWAIQEADAILHLRILASGPAKRWTFRDSCLIGAEYTATRIRVLKIPPGQGLSWSTIRFVQEGIGRAAYSTGQEYVALLRWEARMDRFHPVAGALFMFQVRDGRVVWTRTDAPTLKDGMLLENFLAALGALLPNSRPR